MDHSAVARRAEQDIMRLCHAGHDSRTVQVEALRRLRKIVPVDAVFCATVDPATLLFTGSLSEEIPGISPIEPPSVLPSRRPSSPTSS